MIVDVGKKIRELRERKGMTQADLAMHVYARPDFRTLVARTERRGGDLTLEMLGAYAFALDVTVLDLLGDHPAVALLYEDQPQPTRVSARRARAVTIEERIARIHRLYMEALMNDAKNVTRGFYQHYKGAYYFVHGVATNHDDLEHLGPMVIYESVQGCEEEPKTMRFRPLKEFQDTVEVALPCTALRGPCGHKPGEHTERRARFTRVSVWTQSGVAFAAVPPETT